MYISVLLSSHQCYGTEFNATCYIIKRENTSGKVKAYWIFVAWKCKVATFSFPCRRYNWVCWPTGMYVEDNYSIAIIRLSVSVTNEFDTNPGVGRIMFCTSCILVRYLGMFLMAWSRSHFPTEVTLVSLHCCCHHDRTNILDLSILVRSSWKRCARVLRLDPSWGCDTPAVHNRSSKVLLQMPSCSAPGLKALVACVLSRLHVTLSCSTAISDLGSARAGGVVIGLFTHHGILVWTRTISAPLSCVTWAERYKWNLLLPSVKTMTRDNKVHIWTVIQDTTKSLDSGFVT